MVAEYHAPSLWLFHPPQQWDVKHGGPHLKYSGEGARQAAAPALFSSSLRQTCSGMPANALSIRLARKRKLNFKPDLTGAASQNARGPNANPQPEREMWSWLPNARIPRAAHHFNTFAAENCSCWICLVSPRLRGARGVRPSISGFATSVAPN